MKKVHLFSLDFGSTTSCAMLVEARLEKNQVTGKMYFENPCIVYKSDPVFTPVENDKVNEIKIGQYLQQWLSESRVEKEQLFSGGAIFTGLTAKKANVEQIASQVDKFIGPTIANTIDDPNLESWLAYLGNFSYSTFGDQAVLNLDIGGGTTNPAVGIGKSVLSTGCYAIGARHFQFEPGSYRLTALSGSAQETLQQLNLNYQIGDTVLTGDIEKICDFYVAQLKRIKLGQSACQHLIEVPLEVKTPVDKVLLSGGVGEVYYDFLRSGELPPTTYFGDLGVDLVKAILRSNLLQHQEILPKESGRATVYGMALFNTDISGSTVFLDHHTELPLNKIPIIGSIRMDTEQSPTFLEQLKQLLMTQIKVGGALFLDWNTASVTELRGFGKLLRELINEIVSDTSFNIQKPLIFFVPDDVALTFGNYLTQWREWTFPVFILDEVPHKDASFVNIGRKKHHVVPVSFHGIHQMRGLYA
ncbi:ethanolamine ammonia-lyase reactivating factor EutA [Thiomicrorhabdus sp.]|uniref:ethanolamine ammonia-lyase reactivating factor EutA n=1 Tax=Thiomicrorhabdus sp. TaxID=2039724 RepID=UPI0029C700CD|nr:ethanolamine ammonia-lyase reactivating factor EutA [Thiomicrorhabdus sp.]